jgi:hypothetical protein
MGYGGWRNYIYIRSCLKINNNMRFASEIVTKLVCSLYCAVSIGFQNLNIIQNHIKVNINLFSNFWKLICEEVNSYDECYLSDVNSISFVFLLFSYLNM